MLGMDVSLGRGSRTSSGEYEQADAEGRPDERGHGGMSSGKVVYSVDNAIEAHRFGALKYGKRISRNMREYVVMLSPPEKKEHSPNR